MLIERTLFVGPQVPLEVKEMIKLLPSLDKTIFRQIIQVMVGNMEGIDVTAEQSILELKKQRGMEKDFDIIYSGLHSLIHAALRMPSSLLKQETFTADLKEMKIPSDFVADLTSVIYGPRREKIDKFTLKNKLCLPHIDKLRWRVDVTISTSHLNRVLEPSVLMEMNLSNGQKETFEVPMSKFHKLRHDVAQLLKEMDELEKRNIFKIQDK
ncbi:COMMD5 (predicted) [Pycnogonum litorale]